MKPIYQIRIAEPCHEDWNKMSPTEQGKFCHACQKQVVDFTGASDKELIRFIESSRTGTCGRFAGTQLERPISMPAEPRKRWWAYWVGLTTSFLVMISKSEGQTAKGRISSAKIIVPDSEPPVITVGKMLTETTLAPIGEMTVTGIVEDARGEPIPGASIVQKGTKLGTSSGSDGRFSITLKGQGPQVLKISSVGFETKEIPVGNRSVDHRAEPLVIKLDMFSTGLGEVVIVSKRKRRWTNLFRRDTVQTCVKPVSPSLIIYPNPVAAGATVNLVTENLSAGRYIISVMDMSGNMVQTKIAAIDAGKFTTSFEVTAGLKPGVYSIRIAGSGKVLGAKVVVQ